MYDGAIFKRDTIPSAFLIIYGLFQNTVFKEHPPATACVHRLNYYSELHYYYNVILSIYTLENQLIIDSYAIRKKLPFLSDCQLTQLKILSRQDRHPTKCQKN